MSFLFGGFRDKDRPNNGYPSEYNPPTSIFTRLCDHLINNDAVGLHKEFTKNSNTTKCVDCSNMRDKHGNTILHMAVIYGCDAKVFDVLLKDHKLDDLMFKTNNSGETPYRMAVRFNMKDPLIYFEKNINAKVSQSLARYSDVLRQNSELQMMYDKTQLRLTNMSQELDNEKKKNRSKRSRWYTNLLYSEENESENESLTKRRCLELESQNNRYQTEIKELNYTNDLLESENRRLQIEVKDIQLEYDGQSNRCNIFEIQNKELKLDKDRLVIENNGLTNENKHLTSKIEVLRKENNDLIIRNKKLETQVESFVNATRRE